MGRIPAVLALALTVVAAGAARAAEVSISCGAVGRELELCRQGAEAWAQSTGHTVKIVSTPNSTSQRLALYQQLLAAGTPDIDVFQVDVVWPGILGAHFIDLRPHVDNRLLEAHFPAIIRNNTVQGRLVALPWFLDAGLLYYRRDLLEKYGEPVPTTWAALTRTAARIQKAERPAGNKGMWGFVWQGRAYEGLTCNALEWIAAHGGGTIVAADGRVTVNNPAAAAALDMAAGWVGTITPKGVLNYQEEEARGVFQSGNAVFMRNWPYAWSLANAADSPVRGKVGVAALPGGGAAGRPAATLGGWQLAVSRYSANVGPAVDLVTYLTGVAEQKRRAVVGSYNPTIAALYRDDDVLRANPFFATLYDTVTGAVARPSRTTGIRYNRVSTAFWNAVHDTLSGKGDAAANLARLESRLNRIGRNGRW